MSEPITYVGIDAHKVELHVALLAPDASAPVIWKVQNEARAVERLRRKLEKAAAGPVACCYEAGPCGYVLQRQLERGRVQCQVIAPALVPRKPGERIKTDRRDARKLAELHRAGLLTEVRPPTPAEEAVRDLCRARDDARADRQRCRHRLGKLLLRRGLHYPGRAWTQAHRRWVNGLTWPHPADRVVLDDYLLAIDQLDARLAELDAQLATVATTDPYREPVGWLRCFRGIDTLTAMLLLAELHDVQRFPTARALMAYLGAGTRGALQRGASSPRADHEDGQHAGAAAGGGSGVALSTPARRQPDAGPAAERATATGDCAGGQGAAAVCVAASGGWPSTSRARSSRWRWPASWSDFCGRPCTRRRHESRGGAAFGARRAASSEGDARPWAPGTTVAGVASSRASAAPSLRYGPPGDPTPTTVGTAYMAESKLPARN